METFSRRCCLLGELIGMLSIEEHIYGPEVTDIVLKYSAIRHSLTTSASILCPRETCPMTMDSMLPV